MGWSGDKGGGGILGGGRMSDGQARPAHTRLAGTTVGGKYNLGRLYYSDRAGSLYEATAIDEEGKRKLAVYAVSPAAKVDPDVRLVGRHPNFVRLRGLLQEGPRTTLVILDPPQGQSLYSVLKKRGRLQPGAAVSVAVQVLSALHSLHADNRTSGTLSPECVFLDRSQEDIIHVTVVDVGYVAGAELPEDVGYLSPEEVDRAPGIDRRSDIWAVGVLLYEMIYGHRPFRGSTRYEIMGWIVLNDPEYPEPPGKAPAEIVDIIRKALAKKADDRYQTVTNMIGDLLPLQEDLEDTLSEDAAQALRETVLPHGPLDAPPVADPAPAPSPETRPSEGPRTDRRIMPFRPQSAAVVKTALVDRVSHSPAPPAPAAPEPPEAGRPSVPLADVLFSMLPEPAAPESLRISSMAWPVAPIDPRPIPHPKVQWIKPTREHGAAHAPVTAPEQVAHPARKKTQHAAEKAQPRRKSAAGIGLVVALIAAALCVTGYFVMEFVKGRARPVAPAIVEPETRASDGIAPTAGQGTASSTPAQVKARALAAKQAQKQRKPVAPAARTTYDREAVRPQPKAGAGTKQKKIGGLADNPW
jgi:serine/threonine protein kinase